MNIKKTANLLLNFTYRRLAEIFGAIVFIAGILLLTSLISYSPEDPNFIFPENTEIKNILGFKGSFISDLFFQSVGLVSYFISVTFVFTGINIFRNKDFFLLIENTFFAILYSIFGTLFISYFYSDTFTLYINGNGGFVGVALNETFLSLIIKSSELISYYVLIFIIIFLFGISINFNLFKIYYVLQYLLNVFKKREIKNYTHKDEIINEYIPQEGIKNLIQEDLPFIKAEDKSGERVKFKLPNIDLLKSPSKKERETSKQK